MTNILYSVIRRITRLFSLFQTLMSLLLVTIATSQNVLNLGKLWAIDYILYAYTVKFLKVDLIAYCFYPFQPPIRYLISSWSNINPCIIIYIHVDKFYTTDDGEVCCLCHQSFSMFSDVNKCYDRMTRRVMTLRWSTPTMSKNSSKMKHLRREKKGKWVQFNHDTNTCM